MNVVTSRSLLREYARDAAGSTSSVSDLKIDHALMLIGEDLVRQTRVSYSIATKALTADTATFDITLASGFTGFRPHWLGAVWPSTDGTSAIDESDLEVIDYDDLRRRRMDNDSSGVPLQIAFKTATTGEVYPTPDLAYVLTFRFVTPFTTWTAGTQGAYSASVTYGINDIVSSGGILYQSILPSNLAHTPASSANYWTSLGSGTTETPSSVTISIAEDWWRKAILLAGPAVLQFNSVEHAATLAPQQWKLYREHIRDICGAGSLGVRVFYRQPPRDSFTRRIDRRLTGS